MRNKIIALSFIVLCSCVSTGPLKMYSGPDLSEGITVNLTIPAGITLHRIDGIGTVIGYYTRNKAFLDDFSNRQFALLSGSHSVEFDFNKKSILKLKGTYNISFIGTAGRKYRLAIEARSCSNNTPDLVAIIYEQEGTSPWKPLLDTVVDIRGENEQISSYRFVTYCYSPELIKEVNKQDDDGFVIISQKATPDSLWIVPMFGSGVTYSTIGLAFDNEKKVSVFRLPKGKYLTIGFAATHFQTVGGGSLPGGSVSTPITLTKYKYYSYCSQFEVISGKYVYLGRVDYDYSKGVITVLDNSDQDIDKIKEYFPQLVTEQFLVNVLAN